MFQILNDSVASEYIAGMAVHWYWDKFIPANVLTFTHNAHPDKFILATEACSGAPVTGGHRGPLLGSWSRAEDYATDIMEDLNNWVTGWVDWGFALDVRGGPNLASNWVDAPIIVNASADEFYKQPTWYALGHFR
jgi:glucosylceramidase